MPLYTRFGDTGDTMLSGGGTTKKDDARMHAVGTVDELSAAIGLVLSEVRGQKSEGKRETSDVRHETSDALRRCSAQVSEQLITIQKMLHTAGADLATPFESPQSAPRITQEQVEMIEQWIDALEKQVPELRNFILPGGSRAGAALHLARTVCRRAERWIVALRHRETVNEAGLRFFNRLSDYLFAAARVVNKEEGVVEVEV